MRHLRISPAVLLLLWAGSVVCAPAPRTDLSLVPVEKAYVEGRYREAADGADALLRRSPDRNEARFLRAVSNWRLGSLSRARRDIEEYLDQGGLFTEEARELLRLLETEGPAVPWIGTYGLRVGAMHSDRVLRTELPPNDPERESHDNAARVAWNAKASLGRRWSIRFRGEGIRYLDVPEAGWLYESLDVSRQWSLGAGAGAFEWLAGGAYLRDPDHGPDLWRARTRAELSWAFRNGHIGWIGCEAAYDDYPRDEDFSGPPITVGGGFEHRLPRTTVSWDAYVLSHQADMDALSHLEAGGRIGFGHDITDRLSAGLDVRGSQAEFDRYDNVFLSDRTELHVTTEIWMSCRIAGRAKIVPFAEYTANHSNIDGDDYERSVFGLDLVFGVL